MNPTSDHLTAKERAEMNWICAEKVMGWKPVANYTELHAYCGGDTVFFQNSDGRICVISEGHGQCVFNPVKNPADALAVLKKCAEKCCVEIGKVGYVSGDKGWFAMSHYRDICCEAETLETAIVKLAINLFK